MIRLLLEDAAAAGQALEGVSIQMTGEREVLMVEFPGPARAVGTRAGPSPTRASTSTSRTAHPLCSGTCLGSSWVRMWAWVRPINFLVSARTASTSPVDGLVATTLSSSSSIALATEVDQGIGDSQIDGDRPLDR
jgi:hypothetical protein